MNRLWAPTLIALGLMLALAGTSHAGRVPSSKAVSYNDPGARGDITVPYTTNGRSALGVYGGVAPQVNSDPTLVSPADTKIQPNYNLTYYGSKKDFSDKSTGATSRPMNTLRPK